MNIEKLERLAFHANGLTSNQEMINRFNSNSTHDDFIILEDDHSLNALRPGLKKNWIKVNPYIGLSADDVKNANA